MATKFISEEQKLHSMYVRKKSHSEWFKLNEDDVNYIIGLQDGI